MWFSRCWACERKDEYRILWMKKWERKLFSTITHGHTLARTHSGPHIYKQEICLFEVCSYAAKNTWRRTWLADLQGQQGGYIRLFILLLYGADHFSGSYHYPTGKMESDNVCVDDSAAAFAYYSLWHCVWFPLFWLCVCGTNWRLMLLHDFLLCPWTFLYVSLERCL